MAETRAVLAEAGRGDNGAIHARFDRQMRRNVPAAGYAAFTATSAAQNGLPVRTRTEGVTIYRTPERLIAVDVSGKTTKGLLMCGFVIWSEPEPGALRIRRIEFGYLPSARPEKAQARAWAQLMVELRCPADLVQAQTGLTVAAP